MHEALHRVEMMLGEAGVQRLASSCVAVIGLGGVGGVAAETLARSGVGRLLVVDGDVVERTNLNRQLVATTQSVGQNKALAMAARLSVAAPHCQVQPYACFVRTGEELCWQGVSYVVDAIDDVEAKLVLIAQCHARGIPILSCMGAGNRLWPQLFTVCELQHTSMDPLARVMRRRAREVGIDYPVEVVCSSEKPRPVAGHTPGSLMSAAAGAGLLLAARVLEKLLQTEET